jgi:transcriptional regulator with XRE-family HTH domain
MLEGLQERPGLTITGRQLRAARALAGMMQADLAKASGVSVPTLKRLEGMESEPLAAQTRTVDAITGALAKAGITFIEEPDRRGVVIQAKAKR